VNGYPDANSEEELNQIRKAFIANYIYRKILATYTGNRGRPLTLVLRDDAGHVIYDKNKTNGVVTPFDAATIAMSYFNSRYSPDDKDATHTNVAADTSNTGNPEALMFVAMMSSRKTLQEPQNSQLQSPIVGTDNIAQDDVRRLADLIKALNKNLAPACARVQLIQSGKQPSYQDFKLKDSRGRNAITYDRTASNNNWLNGVESGSGGVAAGGKSHLAVIFPGLDPEKYFGKEAENILKQLGLLADIQPALDMSRQIYGNVDLALSFDDGV